MDRMPMLIERPPETNAFLRRRSVWNAESFQQPRRMSRTLAEACPTLVIKEGTFMHPNVGTVVNPLARLSFPQEGQNATPGSAELRQRSYMVAPEGFGGLGYPDAKRSSIKTDQIHRKYSIFTIEAFKKRRQQHRRSTSGVWRALRRQSAFVTQEQEPEPLTSNIREGFQPLEKFRKAVKKVLMLLRAITSARQDHQRTEAKLLSFAQYQDQLTNNRRAFYGAGLSFDPLQFRAQKESHVSAEAKAILSLEPEERTEEQLRAVLVALQQTVQAFAEFPIRMQQSLVKVGTYESFEAKRVIIRQGHTADNFYMVLSGTAVVTILDTDKKTGDSYVRTAAFLGRGNSFGELALMHGGSRTATVTCQNDVELLCVGRSDFVDIFMHVERDKEPEHIQFLRTVDILQGWPVEVLPWDNPKICLFTYFRRGVLMCRDSNKADWVYIIRTGTCKVIKGLKATGTSVPQLANPDRLQESRAASVPARPNPPKSSPHPREKLAYPATISILDLYDFTAVRKPKTGINRDKTHKNKSLPPLHRRRSEDLTASLEEHRQQLDQIFREKHLSAEEHHQIKMKEALDNKEPVENVFVQIHKLGAKETFGLEHVAFYELDGCTSVSLVSDGAEAVLINRKFFVQHLTDDHQKRLRTTVRPYPTERNLQQKLQDQTNWEAFKTLTVSDHLLNTRYSAEYPLT